MQTLRERHVSSALSSRVRNARNERLYCSRAIRFLRHQTVERTQAHSEDFHIRVVRALLDTRVFVKFKSSCTVYNIHIILYRTEGKFAVEKFGKWLRIRQFTIRQIFPLFKVPRAS